MAAASGSASGLKPPSAVAAATNEYFEAEDALGRWLDEACDRAASLSETSGTLFAAWKIWAEANGEFVGSIKRFSENLSGRGFQPYGIIEPEAFEGCGYARAAQAPPRWSFNRPWSTR